MLIDDIKHNVAGAEKAGLRGLHFPSLEEGLQRMQMLLDEQTKGRKDEFTPPRILPEKTVPLRAKTNKSNANDGEGTELEIDTVRLLSFLRPIVRQHPSALWATAETEFGAPPVFRRFDHGQSNPTYYVSLPLLSPDGEIEDVEVVVRKKPEGKLLKGNTDEKNNTLIGRFVVVVVWVGWFVDYLSVPLLLFN